RTLGMIQVALDGRHIVSTILDKAKAFGTDYEKKESNGIGGRVTYVSSPGNTVYLATNYTDNSYNLIDGSKRDTRLLDARVGGTYTPNGIYNAGLYTGWQRHTDHSTDEEQKLFSLGGNFQWNITRLTNLEYSYEKSFREGEAAANDTAEITAQQLTLGNRFTPNWNGNISLRREDFEYTSSGATNSTIYIGKIENSFSLTDSLDLNIGLSHQRKEADDRDSEYKSNNVYVSFTYIY
ncbi:MAG TPA: outer membrane beta-barrel protein, partial [Alphaproteobacteria bacterium]|nr:outer membrane beta-barrel protein [Alphaproteobacteria bacterium]